MTHEYGITVRGYELDSFGHVNNAVYLNYCEQARWEILRKKNLHDYLAKNGLFLIVTEAAMRYVKEAKAFDELIINSEIKHMPPYLVFDHAIKRAGTGEAIARAEIKTLLVDNDRIPHDIPDSFIR